MAPPETLSHSGYSHIGFEACPQPPTIENNEPLARIVRKLLHYFVDAIDYPYTFEQLRATSVGRKLRPLVFALSENDHHPAIVTALLSFLSLEPDDRGVNETRGLACEIVAWRFLARLSESDIVNVLLYELSEDPHNQDWLASVERGENRFGGQHHQWSTADENTSLLPVSPTPDIRRHKLPRPISHIGSYHIDYGCADTFKDGDPTSPFRGLNAMEIAVVVDAKKFLSQRAVQKVVNGIWSGRIVFWDSMSVHTTKRPHFYNQRFVYPAILLYYTNEAPYSSPNRTADPYCRLRVPKYLKAFEVLFFASFLALYYAVLVERNPHRITPIEILLCIWIAAFAYDEFCEFLDAGTRFYAADFWSICDLGIIGVGIAYIIARKMLQPRGNLFRDQRLSANVGSGGGNGRVANFIRRLGSVGIAKDSSDIIDTSFDILSLEALLLVPR
ncbi:MAG: hypothetical protein M1839_003370 [Geoglossum umbratile]|nr:MAG: hypothetical protein M1839_003370 [Geoglossum umbratile]